MNAAKSTFLCSEWFAGGARARAEAGAQSQNPKKERCPFKRPRISGPAFLPGAPAVIDAGRREEAPGANKSPARGRAAPGRESLLGRGTRNKWPPRPSRGKSWACKGAGKRRSIRGARPPVRLSAHRRGIGAGEWGPGGGGAASLWAALGRGLSAALRPPAAIADSKSGGCPWPHPEPLGVPGGDRAPPPIGVQGPLPAGHRPRSVGYAQLTVPSDGLSSGGARRRCAPAMECPGRRRA